MRALFDKALNEARGLFESLAPLPEFAPWPNDLEWQDRASNPIPVIKHLQSDPGEAGETTLGLRDALCALAPYIEWRHTYTEEEVGRDFLNRFGWFELAGPTGHFRSSQIRMTVGYWGTGLYYPWHQHRPEELYAIVSGQGYFETEGEEPQTLGPGQTRYHPSNRPHALTTNADPILAFILWRGAGLADNPRVS